MADTRAELGSRDPDTISADAVAPHMHRHHGPRRVGGRYWCGYWAEAYLVLELDWVSGWVTVQWADGRLGRHCTGWDPDRDRVLQEAR
jgi:hypothetical protein